MVFKIKTRIICSKIKLLISKIVMLNSRLK